MSKDILIPTRLVTNLLTFKDICELQIFGDKLAEGTRLKEQMFLSFSPQFFRTSDGWCADSVGFILSYRIYHGLYNFFGGEVPQMIFEWQFVISNDKSWLLNSLEIISKARKFSSEVLGAFILPTHKSVIQIGKNENHLSAGDCLFVSALDMQVFELVLNQGSENKFLVSIIWRNIPNKLPWSFSIK